MCMRCGCGRLTGTGWADWPIQMTLPCRWTHSLRKGCWVMGMLRILVDAAVSADILDDDESMTTLSEGAG